MNEVSRVRASRGFALLRGGLLLGSLSALTGVSHAQSTSPADESLTWYGITLYGIVDIGLQYDSHGAPFSDYFPAGSADIVQKNSNHSEVGATPSNVSQSRVGLQGTEPLNVGDWSGVFKLETFFNPQSGNISDALKSLTQNNGRALTAQTTNLDSSIAGQAFQQSFVGLSSPTFGTLTFGRQNTLMADGIAKYDPQSASQAFALIGLSGTAAGGGDTEDRRLDSSLKYTGVYGGFHLGALYKFNGASGASNTAGQFQVGYQIPNASIDFYYSHVNDAIAAAAISTADFAVLPAGFNPDKSLAATVSDNTTFAVMGSYKIGIPTLFAGYEHIRFSNPDDPIEPGFDDIGGYKLAFVNDAAFPNDKILQVYWAGVKFTLPSGLDLIAAYYGYSQNSYAAGADAGCSSTISGACSGTESAVSAMADYHFTKRFDVYAGAMWTEVRDGLANGYLNTSNIDPTIGLRWRF